MHHSCKGVQSGAVRLQRPPQVPGKSVITANILGSTTGIVDLVWQQEASPGAFPVVVEVVGQGWAGKDCLQLHVGNPACQLGDHDHSHNAVVNHSTDVQSHCIVLFMPSVAPLVDKPQAEDEGHDAHKYQGCNLGSPAVWKDTQK